MLFLKSSSEKGISSLSERTITHSSPPGLTQGAFSHISHCGAEQHSCDVFKNKVEKQIANRICVEKELWLSTMSDYDGLHQRVGTYKEDIRRLSITESSEELNTYLISIQEEYM